MDRMALAFYLLDEEEDETIVRIVNNKKNIQRRTPHMMFKHRNEEGAHAKLITKYLFDDEEKFHGFFRVTKSQFEFVLSSIKTDIIKAPTRMVQRPITPQEKLGITLRYLATGESFRSLAFGFRISHCYISRIIKEVLSSICKRLVPILLPPLNATTCKQKSVEFWERWQFPNCFGAIDGKHVRIICPAKSGSLYFNYKNVFSIVLLAIVDARYKFISVDIGSCGKEGDSGIFAKSTIGKQIYSGKFILPPENKLPGSETSLPYVIVGDEAFRLHQHIMKPYSRNQAKESFEKAIFNYRLSRARRVSENAFGLLCQTFRIFFTPIAVIPETVDLLITATICLHNLIREDIDGGKNTIEDVDLNTCVEPGTRNMIALTRSGGYANAQGFTVRDSFKDFFVTEGVNWQDSIVLRT